jgi:hypothetical protein
MIAAAAMAGLLAGAGAAAQFKDDPQYQIKVSIELQNEPLDQAIKLLAKKSGKQIEAATGIADTKVTVFAKDVPVGFLLDKIASVLDYTWKKDESWLILSQTSEESNQISTMLDLEDSLNRQQAEALAEKTANSAGGTYDQFVQLMNASDSDDQGASAQPQAAAVVQTQPMHHLPITLWQATPQTYAIGQLFRTWSSSAWDTFWNGTVAYVVNVVPENQRSTNRRNTASPTEDQLIMARFDKYGARTLEFAVSPNNAPMRTYAIPSFLQPVAKAADLPLAKEVSKWPNLSESKDPVLDTPLPAAPRPTDQDLSIVAPTSTPPVTMADQLKELWQATGVPIVADGFRTQMAVGQRPISGETARAWLTTLQQRDSAFVRVEDGVVMARHGGFWRLRQYEIPESVLRPLDDSSDHLTVADYVAFVSGLTDPQMASLRAIDPPVVKFSLGRIKDSLPALRFLGSLGQLPPVGQAVRYSEIGASSQSLFLSAVLDASFVGGKWMGSGIGRDPSRYGFMIGNANVPAIGGLAPGYSFLFGSSQGNGVQYQVALSGR